MESIKTRSKPNILKKYVLKNSFAQKLLNYK